ncbi:MAG: BamA/TamA family outer membrane protein [Balneolaceae bacterium]|nr:BamA/TamA family outer membrane protein [Balneolaceae bacterium]
MKFVLILLFIFCPAVLAGQVIPSETEPEEGFSTDPRVGSYYQVFPLAGYTSDWGLFGGGFIQRINYGVHVFPFLSNAKADVIFSTNGTLLTSAEYERIQTFGSSIRSRIEFIGERQLRGHYFGIGNETVYSDEQYDDGFFYYENREIYISYQARKKVGKFGSRGMLDSFLMTSFSNVNGVVRGEESLFEVEQPDGFGENRVLKTGIGLVADSRDSEFLPTRGLRYQAGFNTTVPVFSNDYSYSDLSLEMRHFFHLFGNVVLAHKFEAEHIIGDAPFWDHAVIGTQLGLRGYHMHRFRGNSSLLNIVELRSWLFSMFDDKIRFGAQAFWDSGRVFSNLDSSGVFSDWNQTYGVGGALSLFNPDFFVRGDVGFSNETYRVYFGAGYIF